MKGLQSSKKRLRIFQYVKNKISPKGILFLQDTHSSKLTEKIWSDEFNGDLFFLHGKTNSCGVLVGFYSNINYSVKNKLSDNSDIYRIKNPKSKAYTFRQRHFSGILQRRLDYLLISNNMQELVKNVKILNALSTDHSPLFSSFLNLTKNL